MSGPKSISSPGITRNADSSAKAMDLMRQMAMSGPSLNCMNSIATMPPTVVRQLAPISGMDLLSAAMTASRMGKQAVLLLEVVAEDDRVVDGEGKL